MLIVLKLFFLFIGDVKILYIEGVIFFKIVVFKVVIIEIIVKVLFESNKFKLMYCLLFIEFID